MENWFYSYYLYDLMKMKTKGDREGYIKIHESDCESNESVLLCDCLASWFECFKEEINFSAVIKSWNFQFINPAMVFFRSSCIVSKWVKHIHMVICTNKFFWSKFNIILGIKIVIKLLVYKFMEIAYFLLTQTKKNRKAGLFLELDFLHCPELNPEFSAPLFSE